MTDAEDFQASHILFRLTDHPQAPESTQVSGASGTAWSLFRLEQYDDAATAFREATGIAPPDSSVGFDSRYMSVRSQQLAGRIDDALRGYANTTLGYLEVRGDWSWGSDGHLQANGKASKVGGNIHWDPWVPGWHVTSDSDYTWLNGYSAQHYSTI